MRVLLFISTLILLTSCSTKMPVESETDIFISSFDTGFDADGKSILKDTSQAIRFSKDFWNYFLRTHPKTSAMIFIMPLYDTSNNYVSLPDTSYCYYNVAHVSSFYFSKLLADSITGLEKESQFGPAFFIVPDDTIGMAAKDKRIEQNLKDYQITPTVKKEFDKLKNILTWQDTSKHYIIVFKKSFADKVYKLHE